MTRVSRTYRIGHQIKLRLARGWVLTAIAMALSACGGGGDAGGTATGGTSVAQAQVKPFAQADVETVARVGSRNVALAQAHTFNFFSFFAGFLQGTSTSVGGTTPVTVNCSHGGTLTVANAKSAARAGLVPGESTTLMMANCDAGLGVMNGQVELTANSSIANLSGTAFDVSFRSDFTGFSLFGINGLVSYVGTADIQAIVAGNGDAIDVRFTVPAGRRLSLGFGSFTQHYEPSSTARLAQVYSVRTGALSIHGQVAIESDAQSDRFELATPQTLAGTVDFGVLKPTAGTLTVRHAATQLLVQVELNSFFATVKGDTDRDGSLDLSLSDTWSNLTTGR